MKKKILKKHRGDVTEILATGIGLLMMLAVLTSAINSVVILNTKSESQRIARKYLLVLEQKGTLTGTQVDEINTALEELHLSDIEIKINKGSLSTISYGNDVYLDIKAKLKSSDAGLYVSIPGIWSDTFECNVNLSSISKAGL